MCASCLGLVTLSNQDSAWRMRHDPVGNGCCQELLEAPKLSSTEDDQIRVMLFGSRQNLSLSAAMYHMDQHLDILREGLGYLGQLRNALFAKLSKSAQLPVHIVADGESGVCAWVHDGDWTHGAEENDSVAWLCNPQGCLDCYIGLALLCLRVKGDEEMLTSLSLGRMLQEGLARVGVQDVRAFLLWQRRLLLLRERDLDGWREVA